MIDFYSTPHLQSSQKVKKREHILSAFLLLPNTKNRKYQPLLVFILFILSFLPNKKP